MFHSSLRTLNQLWQKYPIEFVMNIIACSVVLFLDNYLDLNQDGYLFGVIFTYPLYFSMTYLANYYQSRLYKWSWLYMLALCALANYVPLFDENERFWFGVYVIHILLFFSKFLPKDNRQFVHNILVTSIHFLLTWILAWIVVGLFWSIHESIVVLFNLAPTFYIESGRVNILLICFFSTFFFLLLEKRVGQYDSYSERLFFAADILINYLLSPVVMIYTILVYLYVGMILFRFELPVGNVSIITLSYLCLGLACIALRQLSEQPKWEMFFRQFSRLSIVPLGLLWVGIHERVSSYGLTVSRIYLIVIAILVTLFILSCLVPKWVKYRLFGLYTIAAVVITTMVISPEKMEFESQKKQFVELATELNLLDAHGKLQLNDLDPASLDINKLMRLDSLIIQFYGKEGEGFGYESNDLDYIRQIYNDALSLRDTYQTENDYFHYSRTEEQAIPIQTYKQLVLVEDYSYKITDCYDCDMISFENSKTKERFTIQQSVIENILQQHGIEKGKRYTAPVLAKAAEQMSLLPTDQGVTLLLNNVALIYRDELKSYQLTNATILGYFKP